MTKYISIILVCLFFQIQSSQQPSGHDKSSRKPCLILDAFESSGKSSLQTTPRHGVACASLNVNCADGLAQEPEEASEKRTLSRGVSGIMRRLMLFQMSQDLYNDMIPQELEDMRNRWNLLKEDVQTFHRNHQTALDNNQLLVDEGYEGNPWGEVLRIQVDIDQILGVGVHGSHVVKDK